MKKLFILFIAVVNIALSQNSIKLDTINNLKEIIITYKADKLTPFTFHNIEEDVIKKYSIGEEPSLLLTKTPSITAYSDAGYTQGYSYFRIRGMDQTRINITLDGIPLNDPADQGVYLSNYVDILNSVSKIQIQRGAGTSKNGSTNYAGSIELFSPSLQKPKNFEIGFNSGSFNTKRVFGIFNSGLIQSYMKNRKGENYFQKGLYIRFSKIDSDGFKQHSSNRSKSLFLSAGLFFNKSNWKLNILSGNQKNQLSWMGVSEKLINCDRTTNGNSIYEIDDFSQTTIQIKNTVSTNKKTTIESSVYYTFVDGFWNFDFPNYQGLPSNEEEISTNEIKSNLLGFFSNYIFNKKKIKLTVGMHGNTYKNNFTESHTASNEIWYNNKKYKNEISTFQKIDFKLKNILFTTDFQYRHTSLNYKGDVDFNSISWSFFNPKGGLSYQYSEKTVIYGSLALVGREPTRYDIFHNNDVLEYICNIDTISGAYILPELNTSPEYVKDYEIGIRHDNKKIRINLNYYYLDFDNERVLIGNYGPNGLPLTSSVEKSIRTGLEVYTYWELSDQLILSNNSSYNYSIIRENNTQFKPILTPPLIINQELNYLYNKNLSFSISTRYQHQSYINFENSELLKSYILFNGRIDYNNKNYSLSIAVNNITDNYYFNNGSVINYEDGSREKFYFVEAPRNYNISMKYLF